MISVRPITPADWQQYRDLRLQALGDCPDAFGSTYAAEVGRADEAWASRIATAYASANDRPLFVFNNDHVCGLVWGKRSPSEPDVLDVFQMWVAPASRGLGAGRALLEATLAWAAEAGARRVRLGVTATDSPAMRLYSAYGFRTVGELEPLRTGSSVLAQTMELAL